MLRSLVGSEMCIRDRREEVRSPLITLFKNMEDAQKRMQASQARKRFRNKPGLLCKVDLWAMAKAQALTSRRFHDLSDLEKQQEFFQGCNDILTDLPALHYMISKPQFVLGFKGNDDLLPFFHTIDEDGNPTGMLSDLIEKVKIDPDADPVQAAAGYQCKSRNADTVVDSGAVGSKPESGW